VTTPTRVHGLDDPGYIDALITRLRRLAERSDPQAGAESARGKDLRAFEALETAGELVSALAGWAICHTVGLAQHDLGFVPLQPMQTRTDPQYLKALTAIDSHDHEVTGAGTIDAPRLVRRALINLLKGNSGGWPSDLRRIVIAALEGLDYGKPSPIFAPIKESRKAGLTKLHHQLKAICFVEYRTKRNIKKYRAQQEVANAFGVERETVDTWADRLLKEENLGQLEVSRSIAFAHNRATYNEVDDVRYGDTALREAGRKYQLLYPRPKKSKGGGRV
jgi:hypothetical protein